MTSTLTRLCTLLLCICPMVGNAIEWYSSTSSQCWKHEKAPKWSSSATSTAVIDITGKRAQVIDGQGGTFNELGWDALCQLDFLINRNKFLTADFLKVFVKRLAITVSD